MLRSAFSWPQFTSVAIAQMLTYIVRGKGCTEWSPMPMIYLSIRQQQSCSTPLTPPVTKRAASLPYVMDSGSEMFTVGRHGGPSGCSFLYFLYACSTTKALEVTHICPVMTAKCASAIESCRTGDGFTAGCAIPGNIVEVSPSPGS